MSYTIQTQIENRLAVDEGVVRSHYTNGVAVVMYEYPEHGWYMVNRGTQEFTGDDESYDTIDWDAPTFFDFADRSEADAYYIALIGK